MTRRKGKVSAGRGVISNLMPGPIAIEPGSIYLHVDGRAAKRCQTRVFGRRDEGIECRDGAGKRAIKSHALFQRLGYPVAGAADGAADATIKKALFFGR